MSVPSEVTCEAVGDKIRLSAGDCVFEFEPLRPGALLVRISGIDNGQFGKATLEEINSGIERHGKLELFVDARQALGAAVSVSEDWTQFFSERRAELERVHVLVGSKMVNLTVAIAQHLSRTGAPPQRTQLPPASP